MTLDTALIGRWDSSPFDYGVMEASELEFLEDGRGRGTIANALSEDVTEFEWHCPEPGLLEVRDEYGTVERVRYVMAPAVPTFTPDPVPAVRFEPDLFFAQDYARICVNNG
ncbi:hypothetical protein [Streptomyces sp. NPDC002676]